MSLRRLPYEVVSIITQSLPLEDIFHLALSCQRFQYLIRDDRTCKAFLENLASGTPEIQEAQATNSWARAFRILVKRRQAIRAAAPFTAAIVAVAESWLYKGGVLCYIQERTLRVLDLHRSGSTETVVDIRGLLTEAVGETRHRQRYKLQLLHYADGLVTCLYSWARANWLLVFDVHGQRLLSVSPALESTHKIFVRNDAEFLYYGTHSEFGEDGFRRWVLKSYDIQKDEWLDRKIHLRDMVGSDIGQSICFEIIDGHFYGLSNQTSFEVNEADWTSYYHCFCFPVGNPGPKETRRSIRERMWRRQPAEGPIDDRWSFIRLLKNEETGELQILESRKELLNRGSGQRIYYTTDLILGPKVGSKSAEESHIEAPIATATATFTTTTTNTPPNTSTINTNSYDSTSNQPPDSGHHASSHVRTNYTLPTETTTRLRDPHKTHIGDDASTALLFTFSKCPVRSYHGPSQTFLDLVDDPSSTDPQLRLRAGTRHALPTSALPPDSPAFDTTLPHTERIPLLYKDEGANEIVFWPPTPTNTTTTEGPEDKNEDAADAAAAGLDLLGRVLNPPSHVGCVQGTWDERSFVYSTGSNADGVQAVVFVGFDPAIQLRGVQKWGAREGWSGGDGDGGSSGGDNNDDLVVQAAGKEDVTLSNVGAATAPAMQADVCGKLPSEADETRGDKGKKIALVPEADDFAATWATEEDSFPQMMLEYSSGDEELDPDATSLCSSPEMQHTQQSHDSAEEELQWAWEQPAMYQEIAFGFNGLPDFTQQSKTNAAAGNTDASK